MPIRDVELLDSAYELHKAEPTWKMVMQIGKNSFGKDNSEEAWNALDRKITKLLEKDSPAWEYWKENKSKIKEEWISPLRTLRKNCQEGVLKFKDGLSR